MKERGTARSSRSPGRKGESAVFFDRDGTLIVEVNYLADVSQIRPLAGALEAVRKVNQAGLPALVVTNQSAVARGRLSMVDLEAIHRRISDLFRRGGAVIDGFYSCVHHPDFPSPGQSGPCACRKPEPGLILEAARERNIRPDRSFLIGDRLRDVEAGRRAGCRCVLVKTGYGANESRRLETPDPDRSETAARPHHVAPNVLAAVDWILEQVDE